MFLKRKILEILEGCERSIPGLLLQLLSCQSCVFLPSNLQSSRHDARHFSKVVQKPYFHNQHGSHDRMQSLTWILLKSTAMVEDQWKRGWSSNAEAQWWCDQRSQDEQRHGRWHEYGSWQERGDPWRDRSRSREKTQWHWGADSGEAPACPSDGTSWRYNIWSEKKTTSGGGSNWRSSWGQEWSPQQASNSAGIVPPPPPRPPAEWSRIDEGRYWEPSWGQEWSTPPAANSAGSVPPPPPRPPAEWSRSEEGRNWGSSWGQEWPSPPASNSAGSVPHPPQPPAEWSRSDQGRNWESSWGQEWSAPPASNSAGSVQPHPPRPPAEWVRSDGDWNWEASSGPKVPAAPVSNSGGSFPPPHSQASAEQSRSHRDSNRQAGSWQNEPAPPVNAEADDLENWGSKWRPISPESGEKKARHNSNCLGVQNLMVIIDKVIQRANRDQQLSAADLIGIFGQYVKVQTPSLVLPGTVIRLTGNVGQSWKLVDCLAETLNLPTIKGKGRYQKWGRDEGNPELCHWSLNSCDNDGQIMHQSFHSVFTKWHQSSIFILSGEKLHDVGGFEQFINCSVHFIPSPDEESTKCSIAVSSDLSLRDQAVWILLHALCRIMFPAYEIGQALSEKACQNNSIHNLYIQ